MPRLTPADRPRVAALCGACTLPPLASTIQRGAHDEAEPRNSSRRTLSQRLCCRDVSESDMLTPTDLCHPPSVESRDQPREPVVDGCGMAAARGVDVGDDCPLERQR